MSNNQIIPNVNTIHVVSELIILSGITFYFSKKHNYMESELNKVKSILQHQNVKLTDFEKNKKIQDTKIADLESLIINLQKDIVKLSNNRQFQNNNEQFINKPINNFQKNYPDIPAQPFSSDSKKPHDNPDLTETNKFINNVSNNTQHKNNIQSEQNSQDLQSDNQTKILNDMNEILNNDHSNEQPNTFVFNQSPFDIFQMVGAKSPETTEARKIEIIESDESDNSDELDSDDTENFESDSQLDEALQDEIAELKLDQKTSRHKHDLNNRSPSNNSELSITDE